MNAKKKSATIVKSGIDIKTILKKSLEDVQCFEVSYAADSVDYPETDILICSLELTHSASIQDIQSLIKKYLSKYSIVIFCEPSSLSSSRLSALGYKSVHELFFENKMFLEVNFENLSNFGIKNNVTSICSYGYNPIYSVKSERLIRLDDQYLDYNKISNREDVVIEFPVFDMEIFVLSKFNAPEIDLSSDVTLIQYKLLQPNACAGNMFLHNFQHARNIGEIIYKTENDNISLLEKRTKKALLVEDHIFTTDNMDEKIKYWRQLTAFTYEKISIVRLDNCCVTGCGFIYSNNNPIANSDYLLPFLTPSTYQSVWKGLQKLHPLRCLEGATIIAFNHLYYNYYHFLAECLQSAYLIYNEIKSNYKGKVNIVTCKLTGFLKEYYDILFGKNPNVNIIELNEFQYIMANNIYYSPELLGYTTQQPCLIAERENFKNSIIEILNLEKSDVKNKIIYISRRDTNTRKILNEAELIMSLEDLGVEIIELTGKSVKEQIRLFSDASLVIGGHGAGISNSLFMKKSATMLELVKASYPNVGPMRLAQSSGAQYVSMLFFRDGEGDSWYVDIGRITRFVQQYKNIVLNIKNDM